MLIVKFYVKGKLVYAEQIENEKDKDKAIQRGLSEIAEDYPKERDVEYKVV